MKILVTGGAGYLGSLLVPELLSAGWEVTVVDNFLYGVPSLLDCCADPRFDLVRGDARDEALMSGLVSKADCILPLACLVGVPACDRDPIAARTTDLDAVRLVLKLRGRSQKVVFPTTNSGYGIGKKDALCDEKSPLKPLSLYGKLKVDAEDAVLNAGNSVTLRLATAFGMSPRMRLDLLVNDFTYRAVTDRYIVLFEARFRRNFIHARDVAGAFRFCLEHPEAVPDGPYNVGLSSANLDKRQLCEKIAEHVKDFRFVEAETGEDPDKRDYIVSNKKIEATGWRPRHSLEDGIRELVKGYRIIRKNQYSNAW
ncbi:MAG: NAD(P)-dependent oxidoreductase [Elusimicrobiota bacterium]